MIKMSKAVHVNQLWYRVLFSTCCCLITNNLSRIALNDCICWHRVKDDRSSADPCTKANCHILTNNATRIKSSRRSNLNTISIKYHSCPYGYAIFNL